MDVLNLTLMGWVFALGSGFALALGCWIIIAMHRSSEGVRRHLVARVLDDSVLFAIWILGLAGGIGVLLEKSWSRWVLELFCWALLILIGLSATQRWRAAPPPRGLLVLSLLLFLLPLMMICGAAILTLRGETALRVLVG